MTPGRLKWEPRGFSVRVSVWSARAGAVIAAIPCRVVLLGLGSLALVVSNRLPVWLALPAQQLQARLAARQPPSGATFSALIALLTLLTLLAAFGCFVGATRATFPPWLRRAARWLAFPVLLWSLFASIQTVGALGQGLLTSVTQSPPQYTSDEMYYNQYSALLVLRGVNPYTDANDHLIAAMTYFHIRGFTPIARGRFSDVRHTPTGAEMRAVASEYSQHPDNPPPELDPRTLHSYPAGAFLVDVPSVWLGLPGMGFAQILLFIALSVAIVAAAPPGTRLALAAVIWANPVLAQRVVNGDFDIWWLAALIAAWMLRERRWSSGALLGVACAVKQTAWIAAPFYLVWVWREHGFSEALRRAGIASATFLVINLPWVVLSPRAWLESLLLPLSLPLLPDGSGLIALGRAGAGLLPARAYTLLEVALWLGALAWCWRMRARYPFAGLMLGLAPLLVAWRSPERYFLPLSLLALAAVALTWRAADERLAVQTAPGRPAGHKVRLRGLDSGARGPA